MPIKEAKITRNRLRSSYITSVISVSLVLFLIGLVGLLLLNAKKLSDHVKEHIGFTIFLKEGIKEVEIFQIQKSLDSKNYVKETRYISKEQAAKDFQEELGEDFINFLGYNPLGASIEVFFYARYANPDSIMVIEKELQEYSEVKEVVYQKSLVQAVNDNVKKISLIILLFSAMLFLIAVALINNTIRLSVYSKRFLIRTMQLVGATGGFIRRPFLYRSAFHGILAAIIAIGLIIGIIYYGQQELEHIISLEDFNLLGILGVMVLFFGIIINWISTYFAVNKYLRIKTDLLYN